MSKNLNEVQNATVGMAVGCIEVASLQPLNYAKNMAQIKQPISLNPAVMYRGVGANALNMGGCTMLQFAVGGYLKKTLLGQDRHRHLTLGEEMMCGVGAGVASAVLGSPLELVMIQQQRKGTTVGETLRVIMQQPSNVGRGWAGCTVREALWTCGYLSIPPVVRRNLLERFPEQFPTNDHARIPAALLGAFFGCYMTHAFDTVKTCMQGDLERKQYTTLTHTAQTIYQTGGWRAFYRGASFRYARMVCGVFIMDMMQEKVGTLLFPSAFSGSSDRLETPLSAGAPGTVVYSVPRPMSEQ